MKILQESEKHCARFYAHKVNKENSLLKIAKPCLRSGVISIVLQAGSSYFPRIKDFSGQTRQGGLMNDGTSCCRSCSFSEIG